MDGRENRRVLRGELRDVTSTTSGLKLLPRVSLMEPMTLNEHFGSKNANARLPRDYQLSAGPVQLHKAIPGRRQGEGGGSMSVA